MLAEVETLTAPRCLKEGEGGGQYSLELGPVSHRAHSCCLGAQLLLLLWAL